MSKAMISHPWCGPLLNNGIELTLASEYLRDHGYEIVSTYYCGDNKTSENLTHRDLLDLAKCIRTMATCDAVLFCDDWKRDVRCRIEHKIAKKAGLLVIYGSDTQRRKKRRKKRQGDA